MSKDVSHKKKFQEIVKFLQKRIIQDFCRKIQFSGAISALKNPFFIEKY